MVESRDDSLVTSPSLGWTADPGRAPTTNRSGAWRLAALGHAFNPDGLH